MHKKLIEFNAKQRAKEVPELRAGDVIKVYRKIKEEEKERIQMFEGMIIAIKGRQSSSPTMTVRKSSLGIGVELILPIYSPMIEKIEFVKRSKTRRAKLYFVREKSDKELRRKLKDTAIQAKKSATPTKKATPKEKTSDVPSTE